MITRNRWLALLLVVLLVAVGCKSSIGVKTVPRDQFDYAEVLRDAWKEQMLLNLVGLRYAEAPMFLKVTSVINQYSFEGAVAAAAPGTIRRRSSIRRSRLPGNMPTNRPSPTYRSPVPSSRAVS